MIKSTSDNKWLRSAPINAPAIVIGSNCKIKSQSITGRLGWSGCVFRAFNMLLLQIDDQGDENRGAVTKENMMSISESTGVWGFSQMWFP